VPTQQVAKGPGAVVNTGYATSAASDMPSSGKSSYVSASERESADGKLTYGMDRELEEKKAAKYDPKLEAEARAWIEAVVGEPIVGGTFQEGLKSGIVLVNLVRALSPDIIKPPSKMSAPFKQMENIGNYLAACTKLGQKAHDSFQTVDLYENKNIMAVVSQILSLGSIAQKMPGYSGPVIGVKTAVANKREFTEEQITAGKATTTFLGKGSHGTPAEGTMGGTHLGRQVVNTAVGAEGLGVGGEATFLAGKGSHGTPADAEGMMGGTHLTRQIAPK